MSTKSVIITAAGIGKRMGSDIPKQFLCIHDKPIIFHTIEKFLAFDPAIKLVVVLSAEYIPLWENLCQKYLFTADHKVVVGGAERFHSIQNGLAEVTTDLVAIHDAVRPMVSVQVIENCFSGTKNSGACIPVIGISESVRKVEFENSFSVNRDEYKLVQTPQCFKTEIVKQAYLQHYSKLFTDDASVVEAAGTTIQLVEGNRENIKITTPYDLQLAELFLK